MDIAQLRSMGAFVSSKPICKTIEVDAPVMKPAEEWEDPDVPEPTGETETCTLDVYLKHISSADQMALANAPKEDQTFHVMYTMIVNPDGTRLFESVEQVKSLAAWISLPLMLLIGEFNQKK